MRWHRRGAGGAAPGRRTYLSALLAAVVFASSVGCATFGRRGPNPETVAACRELTRQGIAAIETGQCQQAEELLRRSLETMPNDAESRRYLAEVLWRRGANVEAMTEMAEAIRLDPSDAKHEVRAGEMSLTVGAREAALAHAEQAIRLDPKLSTAWALRGRAFWQLNQPDRALADLQRSLDYAPASTDVLLDVAVIYRQRSQPERCLTTLHRLLDTYPHGAEPQIVTVLEGLTLLDLERPQQAAEILAAAVQKGPPNVQACYGLAQAQAAAGRYAEASAAAQQALAIDGSHQPSRQLLGELTARMTPLEPLRR